MCKFIYLTCTSVPTNQDSLYLKDYLQKSNNKIFYKITLKYVLISFQFFKNIRRWYLNGYLNFYIKSFQPLEFNNFRHLVLVKNDLRIKFTINFYTVVRNA